MDILFVCLDTLRYDVSAEEGTGGADGESGGFKPFTKTGNWPLRDDVPNDKNPVSLPDLGARANDVDGIYSIFPDVQDMWTFWRDQAPK